jgi:hypothetical protein
MQLAADQLSTYIEYALHMRRGVTPLVARSLFNSELVSETRPAPTIK